MNQILEVFAGYVLTCKTENTPEWMEGLADSLNVVAEALECPMIFEFDSDCIRGVGVGDEHVDGTKRVITCTWKERKDFNGQFHDTECGAEFEYDMDMKFCSACGKPILLAE